jgi:hypothetical protein
MISTLTISMLMILDLKISTHLVSARMILGIGALALSIVR